MSIKGLFKKTKDSDKAESGEVVDAENTVTDEISNDAGEVADAPLSLIVGYMPGAKIKEADSYVRGLMMKVNNDLHSAGYSLVKFRGGVAYEIQEGGSGYSWLKSILKRLEKEKTMVVPSGGRLVKIELEENGIHCSLLREGKFAEGDDKVVTPSRGSKLKQYHNYVQIWLNTTVGITILSLAFFMLTLWGQKAISENEAEKIVIETISKTQTLPILYWPEVMAEDMYVAKLEFKDGKWLPPLFKSFNDMTPEHEPAPIEVAPAPQAEPTGFVPPPHIPGVPDITVNPEPVSAPSTVPATR